MTARTHDAFAFASLITAVTIYPPTTINVSTLFLCVVGNVVGALIPDMDQASNRLWDLVPAGDFVGKIFRRFFFGHRTISHSFLGFFLFYKFFEFVLPQVLNPEYVQIPLIFWSIMIGYASHLLADAMTKDGVPLLFPFSFKFGIPPLRFLRVTTGSWVENFVVMPLLGLYLVVFIQNNREILASILKIISS